MDEYKLAIEAIVRPLGATERRKNTLRRELWSHFCALVDERCAGEQDEAVAAREALARLGSPEEIRESFYAAIPRSERISYRFNNYLRRRGDEGFGRYALRFFLTSAGAFLALSTFIVVCVNWFGRNLAPERWIVAWFLVSFLITYASVWLFGVMLHLRRMEIRLRRATLDRRTIAEAARLAGAIALAGIPLGTGAALAGYAMVGLAIGFNQSITMEFAYLAPTLAAVLWVQFGLVIPFSLLRAAQRANPIPGWPYEATLS